VPDQPSNEAPNRLIRDCRFGEGVVVQSFTNLYGCSIGANSHIGPFVEVQEGASVGANCKVQSHSLICAGVTIGDGVFVGHGVIFVNDKHPRATNPDGSLQGPDAWALLEIAVESEASIGSAAVIMGGVTIGRGAMVGAGAVVTRDVPAGSSAIGVPARVAAGRRKT
jgi:UDP-2-acetamido-3-amino-2,3-dideoxy-glucuronate N-acetyltransferase